MSFQVKETEFNGQCCLQFFGQIDEEATFPEVTDMQAEVVIDLQGVSAINSVGIRSWMNWFSTYGDTNFIFIHCPKAITMQMNMVQGFLPAKSRVESFEVPFFCENCDQETDVLFCAGKEVVVQGGRIEFNYDKASICGADCGADCQAELDVNEGRFFRFLTLQAGDSNKPAA